MASVKSLQRRFESALESSDLYTAEQTCRTISHRLRAGRGGVSQESKQAAREALLKGTLAILERGDVHSGTALALDLVRDMQGDELEFSQAKEVLFTILNVYGERQLDAEQESEKLRFIRACIEYSKKDGLGERTFGDETLHSMAAEACWQLKDYAGAQKHFLRSNAPQRFAVMLLEWSSREGLKSEVDLFLTRAVLEYLCTSNVGDANVILEAFTRKYGKGFTPLANFCEMLLQVVGRSNAHPLLVKLREAYKPSLDRDPAFGKQLDTIGEMYFGVRPARSDNFLQDMMSGMMKNFLGGAGTSRS